MLHQTAFIADLDLKFFKQAEFEPIEEGPLLHQAPLIARNVLRILMMGWNDSWKELFTLTVAHAVFWQRNPLFLKEMRHAFQEGFLEIFRQLKGQQLRETQSEQVQLYLSNCLSLLPYSDLTPYESIRIPQYIDNQWMLVEYQIKPIELTTGSERDEDRVFAYGLEPLIEQRAESHLIFMGTTYPAGQGFLTQVNDDVRGFAAVGSFLYETGRQRIHAWLALQKNPVHVCGTSLGGSISLLLAIDTGNYNLSRIDALNPAGLYKAHSNGETEHWDFLISKPRVVIQKQGNDPVSYFGFWKDDWEIVEVVPPKLKQGPNCIADHALNYAGLKGTRFTYIDATEDNSKRSTRNFWFFSLARSMFYYGIMMPYTYIIRPTTYFFFRNWPLLFLMPTALLLSKVALLGIVPGIVLGIAVTMLTGFVTVFFERIFRAHPPLPYAKIHDPGIPRNKDMDIYNVDNAIDVELTYKEINTYYKIMRGAKKKEFWPTEDRPVKYVAEMTKKQLLAASEDSDKAETTVSCRLTKAKFAHIRHALTLFNKVEPKGQEHLNQVLSESYKAYRLGKTG